MRTKMLAISILGLMAAAESAESPKSSGGTVPETQAPTAEPAKTVIRPDISKMVKTAGGSYHKDDFIGNALVGLTVEQVKEVGKEVGIDVSKYDHLNPGQQRMNVGNALRRIAANEEAAEKIAAKAAIFKQANAEAAEKESKAKAEAKARKEAEKAAAEQARKDAADKVKAEAAAKAAEKAEAKAKESAANEAKAKKAA